MAIFDKQLKKYVEENFAEREKELAETEKNVKAHFAKSREYRVMLQEYQKTLKSREDAIIEKENSLSEREAKLIQKEETLTQRVKEKLAEPIEAERAKAKEELRAIQKEIDALREKKTGLQNAEYRIIDWASRVEKKESSIYDEMLADLNKFQKFKLSIDGYEFENYVASLLRNNGYEKVEVTQKSKDYGADIVAEKDGVRYVFQCKYYTSQVGIEAIQQIYSAKTYYDAHVAIAVTNNVFTNAAKILADELKVILWDCEDISVLSKGKGS